MAAVAATRCCRGSAAVSLPRRATPQRSSCTLGRIQLPSLSPPCKHAGRAAGAVAAWGRARPRTLTTVQAGVDAIRPAAAGEDPTPESQPGFSSAQLAAGAITGVLAVGAMLWAATGISPVVAFQKLLQYGYAAAFSLVFVSEIGDKTFFMAALCAMRVGRLLAFSGAAIALSAMTALSVAIGVAFKQVPEVFTSTLPIAEYIAVALLVYFGIRSLKDAWDMPSESRGEELADATETVDQAAVGKSGKQIWRTIVEVSSLVFAAEWGDRSMLAIIALSAGTGSSAVAVGVGALSGHFAATLIAVLGGALIGKYVSEKMVGYTGGILFLAFAVLTIVGVC
mmetsp:Transcript_35473/g.100432  ORF Transcript_35473/g.100432 Transcript_35473/m.100432 type:complete len:339 (+) Transcript_35473:203-1219(+)